MDARSLLARARYTTLMNRKRPKPLSVETRRIFRALVFTLVILLLGASMLFFLNTNARAQKGYLLRQMELQHDKLRTDNEALKQKVLEVQSYRHLEKDRTLREMEPANSILYIPVRTERVSQKKN